MNTYSIATPLRSSGEQVDVSGGQLRRAVPRDALHAPARAPHVQHDGVRDAGAAHQPRAAPGRSRKLPTTHTITN